MSISSKTLQEVEEALRQYQAEIEDSSMTSSTKHTYILHSTNFVRWLKGEFVPGNRTL